MSAMQELALDLSEVAAVEFQSYFWDTPTPTHTTVDLFFGLICGMVKTERPEVIEAVRMVQDDLSEAAAKHLGKVVATSR